MKGRAPPASSKKLAEKGPSKPVPSNFEQSMQKTNQVQKMPMQSYKNF